jgi:uncharacterized membrane protein
MFMQQFALTLYTTRHQFFSFKLNLFFIRFIIFSLRLASLLFPAILLLLAFLLWLASLLFPAILLFVSVPAVAGILAVSGNHAVFWFPCCHFSWK